MSGPKVLVLDIETLPGMFVGFESYNTSFGPKQIARSTETGMFAAMWHGQREVVDYSVHCDGRAKMVEAAADLLDQADILVTYNGRRFDVPHLQRAILEAGGTPPSPWKNVDLYEVVKRNFRFQSNRLDHVARELGVGSKLDTGGIELWLACLEGNEAAWRKMIRYCKQDVRITDRLYAKLLPWMRTHPNVNLWSDSEVPACPRCGGRDLEKRGLHHAVSQSYQQYRCRGCGAWSRGLPILKRAGETRAV